MSNIRRTLLGVEGLGVTAKIAAMDTPARRALRTLQEQQRIARDLRALGPANVVRDTLATMRALGVNTGSAQVFDAAPAVVPAPPAPEPAPTESKADRAKRLRAERMARSANELRTLHAKDPAAFLLRLRALLKKPSVRCLGDAANRCGMREGELRALQESAMSAKPPRKHRRTR